MGAVGSVVVSILADRWGLTTITIVSLAVNGGCCLAAGHLYGSHPPILIGFSLIWGFGVVANSAQFPTSESELADPQYFETVLKLQACMDFLLTLGSIRLIPVVLESASWNSAFTMLVAGPVLGAWSVWREAKAVAFCSRNRR